MQTIIPNITSFTSVYIADLYKIGDKLINGIVWNYDNLNEVKAVIGYHPVEIKDGELYVYGRRIYQYDFIFTYHPHSIDRTRRTRFYNHNRILEEDVFVLRSNFYELGPAEKLLYEPTAVPCEPTNYPCR